MLLKFKIKFTGIKIKTLNNKQVSDSVKTKKGEQYKNELQEQINKLRTISDKYDKKRLEIEYKNNRHWN